MGSQQVQQAPQLQTQGQGRDQETYPDGKSATAGPRFYRLKSGHAPTGVYRKRFSRRENDKFWECGGAGRTAAQTREHLFHHCNRCRDQQPALWKAVGQVTGWNAARCRPVQISELFSIEEWDQAVIDFLAATDVRKFLPKLQEMAVWSRGRAQVRRGRR